MWNGTVFGDLDWPLNASRGLSAIAEFLVLASHRETRYVSLRDRWEAAVLSLTNGLDKKSFESRNGMRFFIFLVSTPLRPLCKLCTSPSCRWLWRIGATRIWSWGHKVLHEASNCVLWPRSCRGTIQNWGILKLAAPTKLGTQWKILKLWK